MAQSYVDHKQRQQCGMHFVDLATIDAVEYSCIV